MGEAKRRKTALGEKYGQEAQIFPWLPSKPSTTVCKWSNRGAWLVSAFWLFLG